MKAPLLSNARRDFLKHGVSAMLIGTSRLWAQANPRLRVAVIGCGGRSTAHVQEIMNVPLTEIAAVCDPDRNRLAARAADVEKRTGRRPAMVEDLRKIFDDKSIDAVSITTPNHWHALATIWGVPGR
jgi:ornithine cyclodeaminase/alanine dehydrogenase-like protein (mu-crystallin family)